MQTLAYKQETLIPDTSNSIEGSILNILAYFDVFHYPLSPNEIKQFLDQEVNGSALEKSLILLTEKKYIYKFFNFYSLHNDLLLVEKRIAGNLRAEKLLAKAIKIGRLLYQFPFVRAIGISGSLSKQYADEKADIDFLVITKANRLWIARTIMHVFKKFTFLLGRQHFFCMNYYVDEDALILENRNIYSAIELKTLLPVCGQVAMNNFFVVNKWANDFFPACRFRNQYNPDSPGSWIKKQIEWILNNKIGTSIDKWLQKLTENRWTMKEKKGKQNNKGQTMCMVTGRHFSWMNPGSYNEKVLLEYDEKLCTLRSKMPQWFEDISPSFSM